MKTRIWSIACFVVCAIAVLTMGSSCDKKTDCKANITVVDQSGAAVGNIPVLLYAVIKTANGSTVTADIKAEGTTDASGQASFTFKLPAIYDVRATKADNTTTLVATGIIKLEEGKGVDKTITLK